MPALSLSSLRYVVRSAAAVAMARANKGQVMMPRHHCPPLSPSLMRTSVCATSATTIAIAITWASKVQVMMPRHHRLPCRCPQRARASAAAAAIAITRASEGQVMMPRHHRPPCHPRRRARASAPLLPPPSRGRVRDRCQGIVVRTVDVVHAHGCHCPPSVPPPHRLPLPPPAVVEC